MAGRCRARGGIYNELQAERAFEKEVELFDAHAQRLEHRRDDTIRRIVPVHKRS